MVPHRDSLVGSESLPRSSSVLCLFRFSLPPEVGPVLDDDAVPRVHQQEQGDRGSNSGRDHRLDDCDGESDRAWRTPIALVPLRSQSIRDSNTTCRNDAAKVTFADVGGCDDAKERIREIVENRLNPGKLKQYGVVRNGILLHGPRGSGKTFLAEATAGEFGLNYFYVSPSQLTSMWVGVPRTT